MSKTYQLNDKGQFEILNYEEQKPFASFLPGIAGKNGIPIWAFYVNRGQGIASFGSKDKDHSIMEFYPANKSYSNVETKGFRTFIKIKKKDEEIKYEAFRNKCNNKETKMVIDRDHLKVVEINEDLGLKMTVEYFIMPNENFGALVRQLTITNIGDKKINLEGLDGLPVMIAYGMNNEALKNLSQTVSAWAKVYNLENNVPFYRLRASSTDEAEVKELQAGNFYLSYLSDGDSNRIVQPIVDPGLIFEDMTSLETPKGFYSKSFIGKEFNQMTENRMPCAMVPFEKQLGLNEEVKISSLIGYLDHQDKIESVIKKVSMPSYLDNKKQESQKVHDYYVDHAAVKSNNPVHDAYLRQTFLDNMLRGGFPINLTDDKTYHVFSRKHGDLERDYNQFSLATTPYSQGNGNYRDVNQNRRSDLFINPNVSTSNIELFTNLIQLNGYNPLVIKGQKLVIEDHQAFENYLKDFDAQTASVIKESVQNGFTPGDFLINLEQHNINVESSDELINDVSKFSKLETMAAHGEGYWIDHWTYIIDLIENFLSVYPDALRKAMLDNNYYFYDSAYKVLPRRKKHVLAPSGVRQYNSVTCDEDKLQLIENRSTEKYKVRTEFGTGKVYTTNLLTKLFVLAINKVAQLDPFGRGIEMESDKPGWYDALNGLPGLFGSSVAETAELLKLTKFIKGSIVELQLQAIDFPKEVQEYIEGISGALKKWVDNKDAFDYWKKTAELREEYRNKVFFGISGLEMTVEADQMIELLDNMIIKLENAVKDSMNDEGLFNQFYQHEAIQFNKRDEVSHQGYPYVEVTEFKATPLPAFLEGQVRGMKILKDKSMKKDLHQSVLKSDLYDQKLGMFKVNGDLTDETFEIGRARAFTPGWLENESVWLHMEYKYLLELIKSGQYDAYYDVSKTALIPNLDPNVYGRSTLENSSFILSSANSEVANHGRGYIARLSGATAEYISMFYHLALGDQPIQMKNDTLTFNPKPALKGSVFTSEESKLTLQVSEQDSKTYDIPRNAYAFRFLGNTLIVYMNDQRKDTFGDNPAMIDAYEVQYFDKQEIVKVNVIKNEMVKDLRRGKIERINIIMK